MKENKKNQNKQKGKKGRYNVNKNFRYFKFQKKRDYYTSGSTCR